MAKDISKDIGRDKHTNILLILFGAFLDLWDISGFFGYPEIGTAITKCFEHLEDERYILGPSQLFP